MELCWCFEYALVHNHYMRRGGGRQGHSLDRLAIDTCICLTAYKSRHFAIVETIPLELSGEDGVLLIVIRTGFLGAKHAGESCFAVLQLRAAERLHFLTSMCIISAQPPLWIRCHQSKAEVCAISQSSQGPKAALLRWAEGVA